MIDNNHSEETRRKNTYRVLIIIGICAVVVFVALLLLSIKKRNQLERKAVDASTPAAPVVHVVKPSLSPDTSVLFLPGTIQGIRETNLNARVNGFIKSWYVDIGDQVKAGQLLAELETPELDQQLAQAYAALELAKSSLDRVNSVTIEGAVSTQQKADREGAYKSSLAQVNQLTAQKSFKRVTAPFTGIITSRTIDIGTLVTAGSQQLFTLSQIDNLRIFINVPQSFAQNIIIGTQAAIVVQEIPEKSAQAKVTRTSGALNPDTRTLLVQVEFANPGRIYLPGMYAKVRFAVKEPTRAFIIPANTLIIRSDGPQVMTVSPQQTIALKKVTIRRDYGATVEILSGLTGGENLVSNPSLDLIEGLKVSVSQNNPLKPE